MARPCSTLGLPIDQHDYRQAVDHPRRFRSWLDRPFRHGPALFPAHVAKGYRLKDDRVSARTGRRLRRVRRKATGPSFLVRPSFVLPYHSAHSDDVQQPLFLRAFGKNPMYGYGLERSLGRHRVVGTTVRRAEVPRHLRADEQHQAGDGRKNDMASTVGAGCGLGVALAQTAGADDLREADGVFRQEAQQVQPDYQPRTVRVDAWASTQQAWRLLFALVTLWRCLRHGGLNLRCRGQRSAACAALSERVWQADQAADRRACAAVRPGVPAPRRTAHQHHARPADAIDAPLLGGLSAPAWRPGSVRVARPGVGRA
jgi:hypothetical protein